MATRTRPARLKAQVTPATLFHLGDLLLMLLLVFLMLFQQLQPIFAQMDSSEDLNRDFITEGSSSFAKPSSGG